MDKFSFARQPILDSDQQLYAYEFLFRPIGEQSITHSLTAEVLSSSILDVGLEKAANNKLAFINMSHDDIMGDFIEALPAQQVVIELLEDIKPTQQLNTRVRQLVELGYSFALDDFVYSEAWDELIDLADYIKFDLTVTTIEDDKALINQLKGKNLTFLAEKVETRQQYKDYKAIGCQLFQGYFFCKPENLSGKIIDTSTLARTKLISDLNQPNISISGLEETFKQHPKLTFNLLKFLNSAHFSFPQQIDTIKQAIVLLGIDGIKKWATILSLRIFSAQPAEIRHIALIRAKLAELIAIKQQQPNPDGYFLMGLISTFDVLLNTSIEAILKEMQVSTEIKNALLSNQGDMGHVLQTIYQIEDPQTVTVDENSSLYIEACLWADEVVGEQ